MRLIKDIENISDEDKPEALRIINKLKVGDRVFGNVAEGLKQTLKKVEKDHDNFLINKDTLDYLNNDSSFLEQIALLKAGIKGEEELAEYFERIVKYDKKLQDIVVFASLSDPEQDSGNGDYISDSDFIAIYGQHVLILDAKNINTSPEMPIYLQGNTLLGVGGKEIMEFHPSTYIWRNIFMKNNISYNSINGCCVIVNNKGACIWKNEEWYKSDVRPLHISNLVEFLHDWIKDKDPEVNLSLILTLSKMQIKKEKSNIDIRSRMRRFGI